MELADEFIDLSLHRHRKWRVNVEGHGIETFDSEEEAKTFEQEIKADYPDLIVEIYEPGLY
jgi:hypothetical protein